MIINWFKTSEVVHRFITTALFRVPKDDHTHRVISMTDRQITTTSKKRGNTVALRYIKTALFHHINHVIAI